MDSVNYRGSAYYFNIHYNTLLLFTLLQALVCPQAPQPRSCLANLHQASSRHHRFPSRSQPPSIKGTDVWRNVLNGCAYTMLRMAKSFMMRSKSRRYLRGQSQEVTGGHHGPVIDPQPIAGVSSNYLVGGQTDGWSLFAVNTASVLLAANGSSNSERNRYQDGDSGIPLHLEQLTSPPCVRHILLLEPTTETTQKLSDKELSNQQDMVMCLREVERDAHRSISALFRSTDLMTKPAFCHGMAGWYPAKRCIDLTPNVTDRAGTRQSSGRRNKSDGTFDGAQVGAKPA